jgi:formate/nitrite transporter FocA (FNT family)
VTGDIFEVIWVSLIAGVAVTASYSFVVLGTGRSAQARRKGHTSAAIGFGVLAAFFLVVFLGGFVFAIETMLSKGQ